MLRTCVGCRELGAPAEFVRVVAAPDGELIPDLSGSAFGRGAWVHADARCIKQAVPRGFARTLKANITANPASFLALLRAQAERRALSLIGSAFRARKAAAGSTAVRDAAAAGTVRLLVVASDARAAAETAWVDALVVAGRARAFANKEILGNAIGRPETGVIAILDNGLAAALGRALDVAALSLASSAEPRGRDTVVTEVG
ncbi:MAG TPA: DUF448 domain-containing protein [Polyangiaceae bacterium]